MDALTGGRRDGGTSISGADSLARWVAPIVYAFCILAFISDVTRTNEVAYGVFYIPLVATALLHKRAGTLWLLVGVACLLVIIGAFLPAIATCLRVLVINRSLSILAIFATAWFVHQARRTNDRLRAETRRAEAAEQIKTEVFTNLSEEMRNPLHSLLGLMNLMLASARADQIAVLERVRGGGKQLLATIDNLIDLTQIDRRTLEPRSIDLATVAAEAVEQAAQTARDHAITVRLIPGGEARGIGDPWAVRRILENLIAHVMQMSAGGEVVSVSIHHIRNQAAILLTTGGLVPDASVPVSGLDGIKDFPAGAGAGMTLSVRLADAMGGSLAIANQAMTGEALSLQATANETGGAAPYYPPGTTISLLLPLA